MYNYRFIKEKQGPHDKWKKIFSGHRESAFPERAKAVLEGAVPPEFQPRCPAGMKVWERPATAGDVLLLPGHGRAARHSHGVPAITAPPN